MAPFSPTRSAPTPRSDRGAKSVYLEAWRERWRRLGADGDPLFASKGSTRPFVVAHRGASQLAPENTLIAYRHAMMLGASAAECDVQLSADGEVVLMHDRSLSRTTDGRGLVARRSWAQLSRLDAGSWKGEGFAGEPVARLDDLLRITRGRMRLFVELKAGRGLVPRVVEVLARSGVRPQEVVLMSFDAGMLATAEMLSPEFPRVLLRRKPLFGVQYGANVVEQAHAARAHALGLNQKAVGSAVCCAARRGGLPLLTFTVNCPVRARTLVAMGVRGIISDVPRPMMNALRCRSPRRRRRTMRGAELGPAVVDLAAHVQATSPAGASTTVLPVVSEAV